MRTNHEFLIKKWYFDGISDDGRALICYSAKMWWRGLKIEYVSYLYLEASGNTRSKTRFSKAADPEIEDQTIHWEDSGLGIKGTWNAAAPSFQAKLHDSEEGYLIWHCLQPVAKCAIQLKNELPVEGWGYVECLEMTIPPWKLGFNTLRWGRFAHPDAPLVWIEWGGTPRRCWIFDGQTPVTTGIISEEEIQISERNRTLLLQHPVVIEDKSKFLETVQSLIRWLPGFDAFTPLYFLKGRETKWRSMGTSIVPGQEKRSGWVIHELVKF